MNRRHALLGVLFLMLWTAPASATEPVGSLTGAVGRVDITGPDHAARPAAPGDPVAAQDIVRTKSDGRAEITFTDGSIVRIAPDSRVEIAQYTIRADGAGGDGILTLFRGKLRSIVRKGTGWFGFGGSERSFEVQTPTMVSGVRGTDFFTTYQRGVSAAIFREGEGYGYPLHHPEEEWTIEAGEAMILEGFDALPVIRQVSALELRMHLEDTALTGGGGPGGAGKDPDRGAAEGPAGELTRSDEGEPSAGSPRRRMGPGPGFFQSGDTLQVKESLREFAFTIDLGAFDKSGLYRLGADPDGRVGIRLPETGEFIPMGQIPGVSEADLSNYLTETWDLYVGDTAGRFFDGISEGGGIFVSPMVREDRFIADQDWGITGAFIAGTYQDHQGAAFDDWRLDLAYLEDTTARFDHFTGTRWRDGEVAATAASAWVDWRSCLTGIGGGPLAGSFDPESRTWQAAGPWVALTTDRYFNMLADGGQTLQSLDIPAVEIGRATLTGSGGGLDITLSDLIFLGYATGGPPSLWAAQGVSGTFTGNPAGPAPLSGDGLQAEFSVQHWQQGRWSALVENGSGTLTPSMDIEFRGGAAGAFDLEARTFSGSAVGTAGQVRRP
jgi:hypothetical protein